MTDVDAQTLEDQRIERTTKRREDGRSPYESDRDKILYSSALRRLEFVSQVAPAGEGQSYHSRLMHSIKVAQVAHSIADRLKALSLTPEGRTGAAVIASFGGLDPYAAEAGALAHDLGHPPFGHVGERLLNRLASWITGSDVGGFEGNAQSYRILVRLAASGHSFRGLNLTAATFNASLKYPWISSSENKRKYGAYLTESDRFQTTRSYVQNLGRRRTLEAEIVDIADDITYAVHDLEDFFRAGMVPLDVYRAQLKSAPSFNAVQKIAEQIYAEAESVRRWMLEDKGSYPAIIVAPTFDREQLRNIELLMKQFPPEPYYGAWEERGALRLFSSERIAALLDELTFDDNFGVSLSNTGRLWVAFLKALNVHHVLRSPVLLEQQIAQRRLLDTVFRYLAFRICLFVPTHPNVDNEIRLREQLALDKRLINVMEDSRRWAELKNAFPPEMSSDVDDFILEFTKKVDDRNKELEHEGKSADLQDKLKALPDVAARTRCLLDSISGMTEPRLQRLAKLIAGSEMVRLPAR